WDVTEPITGVAFFPGGDKFILWELKSIGFETGALYLLDGKTQRKKRINCNAISISPDGQKVAVVYATDTRLPYLPSSKSIILCVTFFPNSRRILMVDSNQNLTVISLDDMNQNSRPLLCSAVDHIRQLVISPTEQLVAIFTNQGLIVHGIEKDIYLIPLSTSTLWGGGFSPDGSYIYAVDRNSRRWTVSTIDTMSWVLQKLSTEPVRAAINPNTLVSVYTVVGQGWSALKISSSEREDIFIDLSTGKRIIPPSSRFVGNQLKYGDRWLMSVPQDARGNWSLTQDHIAYIDEEGRPIVIDYSSLVAQALQGVNNPKVVEVWRTEWLEHLEKLRPELPEDQRVPYFKELEFWRTEWWERLKQLRLELPEDSPHERQKEIAENIGCIMMHGTLEEILAMIEDGEQGEHLQSRVNAIRQDADHMQALRKLWEEQDLDLLENKGLVNHTSLGPEADSHHLFGWNGWTPGSQSKARDRKPQKVLILADPWVNPTASSLGLAARCDFLIGTPPLLRIVTDRCKDIPSATISHLWDIQHHRSMHAPRHLDGMDAHDDPRWSRHGCRERNPCPTPFCKIVQRGLLTPKADPETRIRFDVLHNAYLYGMELLALGRGEHGDFIGQTQDTSKRRSPVDLEKWGFDLLFMTRSALGHDSRCLNARVQIPFPLHPLRLRDGIYQNLAFDRNIHGRFDGMDMHDDPDALLTMRPGLPGLYPSDSLIDIAHEGCISYFLHNDISCALNIRPFSSIVSNSPMGRRKLDDGSSHLCRGIVEVNDHGNYARILPTRTRKAATALTPAQPNPKPHHVDQDLSPETNFTTLWHEVSKPQEPRKTKTQQDTLSEWNDRFDRYMSSLLDHEGIPILQDCGCDGHDPVDLQLFSLQLFPASTITPRTAFTFNVLEQFRLLHLEGKDRPYPSDYRRDRGREFQRVARQWNYLLAKKSALAMDTLANPLAPRCPACPHPGMNMDRAQPSYKGFGLWEDKGFFVGSKRYNEYLKKMDESQQSQPVSNPPSNIPHPDHKIDIYLL
ncbi:11060_t:CDS:10, partial [Acaulospora colombiana]